MKMLQNLKERLILARGLCLIAKESVRQTLYYTKAKNEIENLTKELELLEAINKCTNTMKYAREQIKTIELAQQEMKVMLQEESKDLTKEESEIKECNVNSAIEILNEIKKIHVNGLVETSKILGVIAVQ